MNYPPDDITACSSCGHALLHHDLQAGHKELKCLDMVPEDPTEGDHRGGCPPIGPDDTCASGLPAAAVVLV